MNMNLSKRANAFTMLEMILVLVIISITLITVAPLWRNYLNRWDLETAARRMVARIRETQQKAIRDNTDYRIVWDTGNNRYTIEKYDGGAWSDSEVIDLNIPDLDQFVTDFTDDTVTFNHLGSAGNCSTNECYVYLETPSDQKYVRVSKISGRVSTD